MLLKCIDNQDQSQFLTVGRIYFGRMSIFRAGWYHVDNCDDMIAGEFQPHRFEVIDRDHGESVI